MMPLEVSIYVHINGRWGEMSHVVFVCIVQLFTMTESREVHAFGLSDIG